jgi:hypothetical protein
MLSNIKNAQKTVYQSNLETYLQSGINMVKDQANKQRK